MHNQCDGCVFGLRQLRCELACEYCLLHQLFGLNRYHPFFSNDFFSNALSFKGFCSNVYIYICLCVCVYICIYEMGTAVAQWLRCCATNRKVAGSIQDGVIEIFLWHTPSDRIMVLISTQSLTEMSTRSISWGKGSRCVRLTTLPPSCAVVM